MPLERINVYKYLDSGKQKAYPKSVADAIYVDDNEDKNIKEYIDEKIVSEINDKVPSWAQSENKPEYTAEEVGALPSTTEIPVIDDTLSMTEQAADAKIVGDKFIEVDGNITTLSESIDKRISDIKTDLANTSDAIIGETEGEIILVNDSGEKGLSELNVYGWSKQSTTTGAQLFDIKKATPYGGAYGLTVSIDGEEIKISGTVSSVPGDGGALSFRILNYPESLHGNTFSADIVDDTGVQDCDIYGQQSENAIAIAIGKIPIGTEVNLVFRLMVNSSSTALPWEPYTGGEASPSPDYPQEIVSAGDSGQINVNVGGKNLIPFPYLSSLGGAGTVYEADGVTYTVQADGGIKCVGTPTNQFGTRLCNIRFSDLQIDAQSGSGTNGEMTLSGGPLFYDSNNNATFIYWELYLDTPVDMTIYPQVEYGTVATAYEPYKTPQTLTLSTPGGLPGIPVDSGGNYTDENGQQWVCDEIDLARGKYVQRVGKGTLNSDDVPNKKVTTYDECDVLLYQISDMENFDGYRNLLCNKYGAFNGYWTDGLGKMSSNSGHVYFGVPKGESSISDGTEFVYPLATPIETDLSAEEIAAYKALTTYKANTTIQNDANTYMKIKYAKDIEQYIQYIETDQEKLEKYIEQYYAMKRNGKVYQTKLWKFATNPTSEGEKLLSNAGLVFEPSTDTTEGQDDYLNGQHPMFEWVNVNYIRDDDGTARPIAIESMDNYATSGSVDVGVMQMSFYWKWDSSNAEYDLVTVSDSPHPELGLEPWPECVKQDGTILPWCIGSKYISGIASDGLLRSQPNLKPEAYQSHNNMITNYQLKGEGYWGSGAVRNLFQIVFNAIKGATKNSQTLYQGVTNWNFQYDASVERSTNETYFPVTNAQAESLIVGNCVEVGYGSNNNGTLNKDRGVATMRQYANNVKILSIETLDENNKAVYLDIDNGFTTTPIQLTDELSSPIIMSSMHCYSGMTDSVLGKHDGSPVSNTNAKYPYRVQGREYAVGGYVVASDVVMDFQSDYSKNVYVAEKGTAHSSSDNTIRSTYKMIGNIPASSDGTGADWWVGDISVDMDTGTWFPSAIGSSNTQGYGDRCYAGGTSTSGTREYLQGGTLGLGSGAGSACLHCWNGLGWARWHSLGCD